MVNVKHYVIPIYVNTDCEMTLDESLLSLSERSSYKMAKLLSFVFAPYQCNAYTYDCHANPLLQPLHDAAAVSSCQCLFHGYSHMSKSTVAVNPFQIGQFLKSKLSFNFVLVCHFNYGIVFVTGTFIWCFASFTLLNICHFKCGY